MSHHLFLKYKNHRSLQFLLLRSLQQDTVVVYVVKWETTKVRPVFHGSVRQKSDRSSNSFLEAGPNLNPVVMAKQVTILAEQNKMNIRH
jgi:hypothetical protein